jgi:putative lipase involved disintegration of autophagic bodies
MEVLDIPSASSDTDDKSPQSSSTKIHWQPDQDLKHLISENLVSEWMLPMDYKPGSTVTDLPFGDTFVLDEEDGDLERGFVAQWSKVSVKELKKAAEGFMGVGNSETLLRNFKWVDHVDEEMKPRKAKTASSSSSSSSSSESLKFQSDDDGDSEDILSNMNDGSDSDLDLPAKHLSYTFSSPSSHSSTSNSSTSSDDIQPLSIPHTQTLLPNPKSKNAVLSLGQMAYNAYYEPISKEWVAIPGWETSNGFGYSGTSLRGYIFVSEDGFSPEENTYHPTSIDDPDSDNGVVVMVIKGTSLQTPVTGGPTSSMDKLNDNKFFSCCCGKAGWSWTPVCGCSDRMATTCDVSCVERESDFRESYYRLATSLARVVQEMYLGHYQYQNHPSPKSTSPSSTAAATGPDGTAIVNASSPPPSKPKALWLSGHSLGGALASLVGLTFDLPAFTYQTPGDLLFAKRVGLLPPLPPRKKKETKTAPSSQGQDSDAENDGGGDGKNENGGKAPHLSDWVPFLETLPIYQFGNDGDPIYVGQCRSVTSSCWYGGVSDHLSNVKLTCKIQI